MVDRRLVESWDGRDYERHSAHQRAWGGDIVGNLELTGDERILDLGCGDGSVTRRLAERVPRGFVLGIDAAPGMLDAARATPRPNVVLQLMDIRALDFTDEFDVIFSNATLHWVHAHGRLLAAVHRALRPGGVFRAEFGSDGNCPNLLAVVRAHMAAPAHAESFRNFCWPWFFPTVGGYEDLLTGSPFPDWRVWTLARDQHFRPKRWSAGWTIPV